MVRRAAASRANGQQPRGHAAVGAIQLGLLVLLAQPLCSPPRLFSSWPSFTVAEPRDFHVARGISRPTRWPSTGRVRAEGLRLRCPRVAIAAAQGDGTGGPAYPSYRSISRPRPIELKKLPTDWNPLLQQKDGLPPFDKIRPEHLVSGIHKVIDVFGENFEEYQISLNASAARPWRLTWEKFAHPLEEITDCVDRIWGVIELLKVVNGTVNVHKAHHELVPMVMEITHVIAQSSDIYDVARLLSLDKGLTVAQQRVVQRCMLEAWHGGIGVTTAREALEFNRRQHELAHLSGLFAHNVATDEEAGPGEILDSLRQVEGLPEPVLEAAAQAAVAAGELSATAWAGPWSLTLDAAVYDGVLRHAKDRGLREKMYLAHAQRGWRNRTGIANGEAVSGDNAWIISRMLELRRDWAKAVGYDSFAELVFTRRTATLGQVEALLQSLQNASLIAAQREVRELQDAAQSSGLGDLMPWDVPFLRERLQEERLNLRTADLRPYLSLPNVLTGLFELVQRLFAVEAVPVEGRSLWHERVSFFNLVDVKTRAPVAGFSFDPTGALPRSGPSFWTEPALSYSTSLGNPRRPVVHIVGSLPLEGEGEPVLLSWLQVQELFGAVGHALQEMLTEQSEGLVAGTRGLELDVLAFPRDFLALWVYDRRTLKSIGRHFKTGESLPEELCNAVLASASFHRGLDLLDQVRWARVDLELHARFQPGANASVADAVRHIQEQTSLLPGEGELERLLCGFMEPFATGFAAGSYTKLWSLVLAADAFEAFQEAGADEDAVRELGLRFRSEILKPGGGAPPLQAFREFRGRIPRVAPALRLLGLSREQGSSVPSRES
mmetsp:Transcript_48007/g.104495  ORF Transcript_48007/g.104495 Transcript_48007/m.104495 type:complete len:835 (-) Transcript_48007:54-2558(-)